MKRNHTMRYRNFTLGLILVFLVSGCNLPQSAGKATPTLGVTQAYQTIEAQLTREAAVSDTPTASPEPTQLPTTTSPVPTASSTHTPNPTSTSSGAISSCNIAAAGNPIDVTIPDDTPMSPGQTFTKIWRLVNAGTCTWTTAYSVALFSGDAMGALTSVPLPKAVAPNESVDIAIDMVAPTTPGTYQGNWKLRNAANEWFGIGAGPGSPFWVRIIVTSAGTTTVTPGTPTLTLTIAPTSIVQASGVRSLLPTDRINLDNGKQNPSAGEDLLYDFNIKGKLQLAPRNGAQIGYYGESQPAKENCQATSVDIAPLLLQDLSGGVYLCYQTDAGRWGWLLLKTFDEITLTLTIEFLTWSAP